VPTFGFNAAGPLTANAVLYVIATNGKLVRQVTTAKRKSCSVFWQRKKTSWLASPGALQLRRNRGVADCTSDIT
jgi:hypothetical protein